MRTTPAPVGTKFADSWEPVSYAQAQALVTMHGVGAVLRYENLTAGELADLLAAGLLVGLVVSSPTHGYLPSSALADEKFKAAIAHFQSLGIPAGVTILADLESMGGTAPDRIAYANTAAANTELGKFDPGAYVGAGVGLTSAELFDLVANRYVKGESRIEDASGALAEPACGWAGVQIYPGDQSLSGGLLVDFGILGTDYKGRALALVGGD